MDFPREAIGPTNGIGRLLDQAVMLFNCVPFQKGTSFKGKNLL